MVTATRLDIGAGNAQEPGWLTLDVVSTFRPDVMGDARRLPFADGSLRAVKAHHVLEHIPRDYFVFHWAGADSWIEARKGLVDVMNEIWRVLEPGGQLWVEVPRYPTEDAISDPTHGSFFTADTFRYFERCEAHSIDEVHQYTCREDHRRMYGCRPWAITKREIVNHGKVIVVFLTKLEGA